MRTLVFPGMFNPPHRGHMALLRSAIEAMGPDAVRILPLAERRSGAPGASLECRIEMARRAADDCLPPSMAEMVDVCPSSESPAPGQALAWALAAMARDGEEITVLLGGSGAREAAGWPSRAWGLIPGALVARGASRDSVRRIKSLKAEVRVLPFKPSPVSSSKVRAILARPGSWKSLPRHLPPGVLKIIEDRWLYYGRVPD